MRFINWLNRYLGKTEADSNLQFDHFREDSNAKLELVRLEDRIVLSVSAALGGTGDVLELNLDAANDEATVSVVDAGATVQVDDGLGLPGSILQFDATQISSILVTGTDSSQVVNFLGQEDLVLSGTVDTTNFTGDVNIGIELLVGPGESPQFNPASTVTYLGQFELTVDQLDIILPNVLNADDAFVIQINGPNLEILDPDLANPLLFSTPLGSLSSINVFGTDGETDLLTLDYTSSDLIDIAISFDGGVGGNDALVFSNGVFDTITHDLTGPGAGSIDFSGNAITEITYTGLEPVFGGTSTANDIVINLPTATLDAVLEDSAVSGEMQIRSLSSAFELTTFASPTDSLTINTSGGNSIVALNSFDTTFAPNDLIISGQSGDTYQLTGSDLLADTVTLTLSGGATLDLGTFNETINVFVLEEGTVIATSGILSAQSDLDLRSGTVQAQLNGTNLIKNGTGTVILDALNGYTGQTIINDGTLQFAQSNVIPNTSNVDLVSVTSVLDLNGFEVSLTSLTGSGSVFLGGVSGVLNINQATATSSTFAGSITGDGSLTKSGAGDLTLSGTNSIAGATNVNDGSLAIEGSLTTSGIIVSTGATLEGSGSINAPVTINSGGVLSPGSSPGIISTGDLVLNAGSTLDVEIDGTTAGTEYDQIQVTGTVDLTGATLNLTSAFTAAAGNEFLLIDNDGVDDVTGTFAGLAEGTLLTFNGNQVYITYQGGDGNDVALTVNTPPVVDNQLFDVDENTTNTTSLGTIVSTDPDVPPDSLEFSVTGGTGQTAFSVSTSGEITVADESQLDFETTTSFDLEILVTDSAGATDTATITIDLNPLNDNAPVVANQIRSVDENALNGTNVGAVIVATDDDLPGDTLTFSETGGTGAAAFDITSDGQIVVADQSLLDFETNPTFTLDILVDDNVGLTTPATITIDLNPLNDNAPVVANQIRSVDENALNGTNVGAVIVATDDDLPGDTLTFSETGGTGAAAFDITSDGQIVVADQSLLDFETNPTFTLDILVDDNVGLTTPATITIDLNDLVETLVVDSSDWSVNDITLIRDGSQLRVLETGTLNEIVPSHNFTNVSSVIITGNGLDNTVRLDASGGSIIPGGGISFDGGIGSDRLVAPDQVNDWDIDGVNAGSLLSDSVTFMSVENLTGNNSADTFVIQTSGQIDGTIDGGGDLDHLDLSNITTSQTVILTSVGSTNGFDGNETANSIVFENIDQLTGGTGTNSLTGIDSAANWTLNGTNSYQSTNTLEFSNFINLTGGSDSDIFNVTPDTEAFNIVGGDPTSNPLGDQLNIDTATAGTALVTSNGDGSGSVSGTFPTITYSEIEDFAISGVVDIQIAGTTSNDTIEILVVGADIEYRLGGILIGTSSLTQTNSITVNAGDGDDSLTVDSALAAEGITVDYDGEGQNSTNPGDVLNLLGTTTSVEFFFTDITSGSIRIDGALTDFITYTGLEPITSTINAVDVTLNYSGVTETITISDAGGSQTTVTSTAGEMLTFSDPTGSLTINTGDGDDIIDINSLTSSFTASLIINGDDGADTLNANASVSLDTGNIIEFNVETINVANGIALTATGIAFNATEVNLDGDLVSTNVSGDATTVNVLGSAGGADIQDAVDVAGNGGTINVAAGVYITADTLEIDESVSILGAGSDIVEIRKAGDPTNNFDVAVNITADNVTISGAQLGWETHTSATDYQGYVVLTTADNTTLNSLLFGDNYRSAVVFVGADNLEVSDSIFEGKFGRAAIRDGSSGSGENFLITRNEFRADHFRWGPIAIGPQGTFGNPNNFAFSGVISFNYFGNGLEAGSFQEAGDQNYTLTITNGGMTADGIDIIHNTFDWQDSATTNANGFFAQPGGIFFDPSLSVPVGTVNITNNIFNGFTYLGPQPTTEPLWNPTGGVFGGALEFDGVDDFGLFQDAAFDVGESGTLSFWVNMDDQGRRNQFFEGLNDAGFEFQFRSNSGGQFFGSPGRAGNGGSNFVIQNGNAGGTEGVWQNLQYTWDFNGGVNPEMHIYIDGVEVGYFNTTFDSDLTQWVATVNTVNELITVGRDASGDRYFDGLMDDVGWFNEALDQIDRDNIRNNGVAALAADARLIAHWDFDQASGDIAVDNKNGIQMLIATNGIVPFGPEFQTAAGQFGGALQFDGIDDFATFQDASFDVGRQGTLNFWVNMDDTGRRNQFFEGPDNGGFEFQYRSNGGGQFFGRTQDGADFTIQQGGHSGVQGTWTNIQYTWDADTGEMHIYLNGSEEPYLSSFDENLTGFDSTHFTDTINGLMNVGRDPGDGRFFEGLMDDIGWFNDVLDQTDRDAIRLNGVANLAGDSRLVAHWNLDDAPGTTVVSGNSGTNIDLYIQAEPPLPPIEGFGVIAPLNSNVTFNAFNDNDLDSNVTLDSTNQFGDPLFAYESDPLFIPTDSLEEQFTIGFGSSAAYNSSEFASDTNTTTPHIGAFQNPPTLYPGVFGSGDIVIFGTDEDDLLELTFTSENTATFVLTRDVGGPNELVLDTVILTDITSITFNGLGGDDVMIINQPDNLFANPSGGILFNGGSQNNNGNALGIVGVDGDTLVINHDTPLEADSVSYVFTPDTVPAEGEDGIITITDASMSDGSTTITFTGLEPIIDNLLVADRDFDFTDATETISLSDDGVAGDDFSFIDSTLSESVLFLNPTNSLTIRTDSTGTPVGVDTIQIDSLDSLFDASLTILAGSDDPVTFQTAVDLGTGDLFVTAESVDILANITAASTDISSSGVTSTTFNGGTVTTTGSQLYNNAVNFVTNSTLTSTGGSTIEFSSTIDGSIDLNIDTTGNTIFNGAIGSNTALTSLTTNAGGTTNINGGSINTSGSQTFNDAVVLGANTILTSTLTGDILFESTLNGAFTLDINTDGNTTFNGTVGNSSALASLTTNVNGTTNINGGSINTTGSQTFNDVVVLGANTVLTSTSTGNITFESTLNGAFTLDINTDGNTTFNDTVGNSAALTSLTTNVNGTTNINGGSINTTGSQTFNDAVVLGANTILTSTLIGDILFESTLNGAFTLDINTDGNTTFNGTVGNSAALASLTTDANGTTNINGGSINTTGSQTFNDAVVLGANTMLTSTATGDILFESTLNGAFTLDINTDGNTTFNGTVGNSAALTSLTTNVNGTTNINGGSVNTTGSQTFNDAVVLGANTVLTSTLTGDITFESTLNGAFTLDINTDGNTTFNGTVGNSSALASLTTDANGTTNINGGSVNTTGSQTFNDAVVLGANTVLTSTLTGDITFESTLNGAFTLDVNTDGNTTFNGTVGNSSTLVSLTTNVNGTTNINGGSVTTTGSQTFNDAVVLGANTILTSTATGDILFESTLNGAFTLDINTDGNTTFNGTVGNSTALTSLTTDTNGTTNINGGSINTTGNQTFNDAVVLGANTILTSTATGDILFESTLNGAFTLDINTDGNTTFNGTVGNSAALTSLTTDANGTTNINGGSVNTTGNQTFNDAVVLGANTVLTSTATGNIIFESTLNGAFTLDVNTNGSTTFNGTVGNSAALTSLTTDANGTTNINGGSVNTTGNQTFNDAVVLGANTVLTSTATGNITFESTLNGAFTLDVNTDGNTIFNDTVGNSAALISLTTDANGTTNINGGSVTTTGSQTFNDAVVLGANTVLTSTATGNITFESTLNGAFNLDVNTDGNTTFNDTVGNSAALISLTTNVNGTTNINGDSVNTTGNQTFNDAVVLGANTVLTSTTTGNITFESTLNGAFTLDINTDGNTTFNGTVGNSSALASLTTDANGTTNINGGSVNTTGGQTFNDAVVLGANAVLTSTATGNITFESTLNGAFTLDINTDGNTTFNGTVGNSSTLASLTTDANGTTNINGGSVNTTGSQTYNDAVVLGANTVLTSTLTGDITFESTLNGAFTLDVNTDGNTTFNDTVGNSSALASLTTDANGTTNINGGSVNTTGSQTYNDAVSLGANTVLTSTATGDITFESTLNGAFTLDINTDGNTTFNDTVGNSAALTSLTTDANGTTNINGGSVNTTGGQTFNDAVVLGANTVLTSAATGNITFESTLNGAFTLDVNTDGNTTFNDTVGNSAALTSLTTDANGTTNINGGSVTTTGAQTYNDAVTLGASTVFTSTTTGNISFNSSVTGGAGFSVDIISQNAVNIIGSFMVNASVAVTAGTDIQVSSLLSSATGNITLLADNDINLNAAARVLSETNGQITLTADNDSSSAGSITMVSGSTVESQGGLVQLSAHGTVAISSITTTGTVTVESKSADITDNGDPLTDIVASIAILNAVTGIGNGNPLETEIDTLTATVSGIGNLFIDNTDAIELLDVSTFDGSITFNSTGTITATSVVSTNDSGNDSHDISLTTTGVTSDIIVTTLTAQNTADIILTSARDILDSDSSDLNITSSDQLTVVADRNIGGITSIFTETDFDPLQTSVDHLDLTSGNIIAIHNTGTTPELINLDAGTGSAGTTFIKATGGALNASLTTGINNLQDNISFVSDISITVPTGLQTSNLRLDAPDIIDAGGGNIVINAVNAILFNSASAETLEITAQQFDGTVTGSDFMITNSSPALELLDLDADSIALTGGTDTNLSLTSTGSVTVSNLVRTLGTGTLLIDVTNVDADLIFNQNIQSETGSVTLSSANDIIFNGASNLTNTSGSVMLTADSDTADSGVMDDFGEIKMADGTFINAGSGIVNLTATDNITISQIMTTNATDLAIHLETKGSIIDAGDTNAHSFGVEDLMANEVGARVTIIAALGAGKIADLNGEIETKIDQVNITNQTSGEIQLIETDGIIIHDITQTIAGNISVTAGGNIRLSGLVQTNTGDVFLNSQASIIDQNDGPSTEINIVAINVDLNAGTGIGVGDTLELSVDTLSSDTTTGDILLHNTATTSVSATSLTTANGNIELKQVGNESLNIDLASTTDGNITISNEGDAQTDILTLTSITAGGTTPEINVSTIGFGNILLGAVTALDGAISVNSAGEINDAVNDQGSPIVDLNALSGSITLEAINGIGNSKPVELSGKMLSINTATGNINISNSSSDETGAITVSKITTALGTIDYQQIGGQSATFEEVSTTNSAITILTDGSSFFENSGILTNVISTDGIGTIQVTATGVNSSIEVNDGFSTAGGTIDLTAEKSLTFGMDGDLSSSNGIITLVADSANRGAGGGGISMSDGTIFDAGTGLLDLKSGDDISIGQLLTTTLTRITSIAGGVIDAGDTGGRDITAEEVAFRTATGVGSANAIETAVSTLAVLNTDSGHVQILNDLGGGLLTIGTVDGLNGVTHSGGVAGDIIIANASPLTVNAPVINSSGGNINLESTGPGDLTLNASLRASGGNGNINVEAGDGILAFNDTGFASDHSIEGTGVFSGHGDSGVIFDSNTTLNSETGAIADVPPDLRNILTPQISATGDATVTGDFGRLTEQNFFITIDWGDGTVETFNFTNPGSFVFTHNYVANPNSANPSADIPILVTMQGDKQFTFSDGTGILDFTSEAGLLETPGEGLATIAIDTTPQVPLLIFPQNEVILDASSNQLSVFTTKDTQTIESAINEANKNAERLVFLRILAPNGNLIEDVPLKESDLDNLPQLFQSLPDGRYQIYLKEAGEERIRLLMDVDIRGGKATDVTGEQVKPAPSTNGQLMSTEDESITKIETGDSPLTSTADIQNAITLISTDINNRLEISEHLKTLGQFETQTSAPRLSEVVPNNQTNTPPENNKVSNENQSGNLSMAEKAWSSTALLSGYIHGRPAFKQPTKQSDRETAMEKYGQRLFSRQYNILKRNQ